MTAIESSLTVAPRSHARTRALFIVAVASCVAYALYSQADGFRTLLDHEHSALFLAAAFVAAVAGVLISQITWRFLMADLGPRVTRRLGARIYFTSFLAKYVPGRVWGLLAHVRMGRAAGVAGPVMAAVFGLNVVIVLLTGLVLGLAVAPEALGGQVWWLAVPVALVAVWLVRPGVVNTLAARVARVTRREPPEVVLSEPAMRRATVAAFASWLVSGVHLWLLAVLLGAPPPAALLVTLGAFALANSVGTVAFFLPDGWGAREVVLIAALATVLPLPAAGVAAVASRLVCTVSETAVAGAVLLVTRRPAAFEREEPHV